jgi:ABC-type uncharacterized transport system YnjBCD ATPase subunit
MKLVTFYNETVLADDDGSIPLNAKCLEVLPADKDKVAALVKDAPLFETPQQACEWLNERLT